LELFLQFIKVLQVLFQTRDKKIITALSKETLVYYILFLILSIWALAPRLGSSYSAIRRSWTALSYDYKCARTLALFKFKSGYLILIYFS